MVHRSMRTDLRVADEVYIMIDSFVLEDFFFFSLYSVSCIAKQAWIWNSSASCLVLISSIRTSKHLVPIMILHYCYESHHCPTPPITLERVPYNVPDLRCTVKIVWLPVLIMFGITVKSPTVISWFATWVATILRIQMWLHSSNGWKYCNIPCSVTCWVYFWPNHRWFHVCNDFVDKLPRLIGFDIHYDPYWSP